MEHLSDILYTLPKDRGFTPLTPPASPPSTVGKALKQKTEDTPLRGIDDLRQRCAKLKHQALCSYAECIDAPSAISHLRNCCDSDVTQSSASSDDDDDNKSSLLSADCLQARHRFRRVWLQRQIRRTRQLTHTRRLNQWKNNDRSVSHEHNQIYQELSSRLYGDQSINDQKDTSNSDDDSFSSSLQIRRNGKSTQLRASFTRANKKRQANEKRVKNSKKTAGPNRKRCRRRMGEYNCDDFVSLGRMVSLSSKRRGANNDGLCKHDSSLVHVPGCKFNYLEPICNIRDFHIADDIPDDDECQSVNIRCGMDNSFYEQLHIPCALEEREGDELPTIIHNAALIERHNRKVSFLLDVIQDPHQIIEGNCDDDTS